MSTLELISADDTINLDSVLQTGAGMQVLAGASGFGSPGVATQWSEGAGNGAVYRGTRVQPRVFDLPLYAKGTGNAALNVLLSRLTTALANPCTLRFTDAAAVVWELAVVRTGGGDYADTIGTDWLDTIVTVQTDGSPFWRRVTGQTQALAKPFGAVSVVNAGDAPSPAVWTVTGPGINLRLTSPKGELLPWNGVLDVGQSLTIDTDARTIVDNLGRNRYGELGTAPRFGDLLAGTGVWQVAFDSTSADFGSAFGLVTYNYITTPRFNSLTRWAASSVLLWTPGTAQSTSDSVASNALTESVTGGGIVGKRTTDITGLTVGQLYRVGANVAWTRGTTGYGKATKPHIGPSLEVKCGLASASKRLSVSLLDKPASGLSVTFVATATTATVALGSGSHKNFNSNSKTVWSVPFLTEGDNGVYFDGTTTDTATEVYGWEGTDNLSRSTKTIPAAPSNATTAMSLTWKPRRWAVI